MITLGLGRLFWLTLLVAPSVNGVYKRWTKRTDFDDPTNWDRGHLPCPNDHIVFPETAPIVVINQDWTLLDLTLPSNGMVILSDNLNLVFNDNATIEDTRCDGSVIRYNRTQPAHWLDPSNWCISEFDFGLDCWEDLSLLDTERIPCMTDDVLFPGLRNELHRSSFYVKLDIIQNMRIRSLQIGSEHMDTAIFLNYTLSDFGSREFVRESGSSPPTLNITNRPCVENAGCSCGTELPPWKDRICSYVTCFAPNCPKAVTPVGNCCPLCGAVIELNINSSSYSDRRMRNTLKDNFIENSAKTFSDVQYIVSRLQNGGSQITLFEKVAGVNASLLAGELQAMVNSDIQNGGSMGILSITHIETSASITTAPPVATTASSSTTKPTETTGTTTPKQTKPTNAGGTTAPTPVVPPSSTWAGIPGSTAGQQVNTWYGDNKTLLVVGALFGGLCFLLVVGLVFLFIRNRNNSNEGALGIQYKTNGEAGDSSIDFVEDDQATASVGTGSVISLQPMTDQHKSSKKGKKLSKKFSSGFDNPMFFDTKTETVGAPPPSTVQETDFTVSNPLYDSNFGDNFAPGNTDGAHATFD